MLLSVETAFGRLCRRTQLTSALVSFARGRMDHWAASFHEKSERRRRLSHRETLIKAASVGVLVTIAICVAFFTALAVVEALGLL